MEIDLRIQHHFTTGVYIKQMHLPAGHYAVTHEHNYDHFGLLGKGEAVVSIDDEERKYTAPCVVEIAAGKKHRIVALTDIDWFCIHHTEETDVTKLDQVLIKES